MINKMDEQEINIDKKYSIDQRCKYEKIQNKQYKGELEKKIRQERFD